MCDRSEDREIYPTSQKTGEISAAFAGLETILHYDGDRNVTVEAVNPYKSENLYIELSGEFTFF